MKRVLLMVVLMVAVFVVDAFAFHGRVRQWGGECYKASEPSTLILLGSALAGVIAYGRKYFKR